MSSSPIHPSLESLQFDDSAENESIADSSAPAQNESTQQAAPHNPTTDPNPAQSVPPQAAQATNLADYGRLSPYGQRQFYYRQRDHLSGNGLTQTDFGKAGIYLPDSKFHDINNPAKGGICQNLTLSWVADRLQTTNSTSRFRLRSWEKRKEQKFPKDADAESAATEGMSPEKREQNTILTAKDAQASYLDGKAATENNQLAKTTTQRRLGLKPASGNPGEGILNPDINSQDAFDLGRQIEFHQALTNAAARLKRGQAVTVEMRIKTDDGDYARHMVGLYKSRGNTLRFFDPDAGEYTVHDPQNFFQTYQDIKKHDRGWNFTFVTHSSAEPYTDRLEYFKR